MCDAVLVRLSAVPGGCNSGFKSGKLCVIFAVFPLGCPSGHVTGFELSNFRLTRTSSILRPTFLLAMIALIREGYLSGEIAVWYCQ
jgi:hypothetical protein